MSRAQYRKSLRDLQDTDKQLGEIADLLSELADQLCDSPGRAKVLADKWPSHADLTGLLALRRAQQRELTRSWKSLTAHEQARLKPTLGAYAPRSVPARK